VTDVVTQSDLPVETAPRVGYVGKRLGRFLITGELGRGGMATVYRARDPELGRDVAIKVMHGFFAGRIDLEARFRREASTVATIRHPSILNVYDFAAPAGEEPGYIVSELIEGPGLRSTLEARGGRLRPEVAALIVARVADALGATHAAGIVHRDVKPDNVLIDRAGGHARVVLTDFGVAHVSSMDTMTATGAVVGSPAYMSPEQARSEEVGAPSDVFSLGVMLYQLSTGHLPFSGKDPLAVITATLRGQFRRPSEIEPRVGPELEKVIVRCLQGDPAARFPNGTAVAEALRAALGDTRAAARLEDEEAALRRFFDDPDAFEAALAAPVAEAALAAAERARKSRQLPRALAELGRALAYQPEHTEAKALLARLNARRTKPLARWLAVLGLVLMVAGGTMAWRRSRQAARPQPPMAELAPPPPAAAAPTQPPAPRLAEAPVAIKAPPETAPAGADGRAAQDGKRSEPPPRPRRRPGTPSPEAKPRSARETSHPEQPGAEASPPAPSPAHTQPVASVPIGAPATAAASPDLADKTASQANAPLARASIALHASYGFCEPSLDGHPASLRASYSGLQPGPHEIYCTLPQGGPKLHVATYELPPGARASVVIIPGPDGRPIIGRSE
jgi:serine/threonine-protein kinase